MIDERIDFSSEEKWKSKDFPLALKMLLGKHAELRKKLPPEEFLDNRDRLNALMSAVGASNSEAGRMLFELGYLSEAEVRAAIDGCECWSVGEKEWLRKGLAMLAPPELSKT